MTTRLQFSIHGILAITSAVARVFAAIHYHGALAVAEGAFMGGVDGAILGLAGGVLQQGVAEENRSGKYGKRGAAAGSAVGAPFVPVGSFHHAMAITEWAAITAIVAAIAAAVRRH